MEVPKFGVWVGRPFRAFRAPNGEIEIQEFDTTTGQWRLNIRMLEALLDLGGETDFMSESELNDYVAKLKPEHGP